MCSSPIDLFDKALPFRGLGSELEIPYLTTFFRHHHPSRADPPWGSTSAQSRAPPTGQGYALKVSSRSIAPTDDPAAAAPAAESAGGVEPRGKFGPAHHAMSTRSIEVPRRPGLASNGGLGAAADRAHALDARLCRSATPSPPSITTIPGPASREARRQLRAEAASQSTVLHRSTCRGPQLAPKRPQVHWHGARLRVARFPRTRTRHGPRHAQCQHESTHPVNLAQKHLNSSAVLYTSTVHTVCGTIQKNVTWSSCPPPRAPAALSPALPTADPLRDP